ncbi:MAG: methyltransferase domain-containing protein [Rhodobacteraceae bacterium]|nr:methyltransferase domain-containing protein [Paracoccaceae bacterium]
MPRTPRHPEIHTKREGTQQDPKYGRERILEQRLIHVIGESIPNDHCNQSTAIKMFAEALHETDLTSRAQVKVVDLGCGSGDSYQSLKEQLPNLDYVGVDIESSPEVDGRTRDDLSFKTYDGINLPFESGTIDIIFCKQVLEHVRHPDALIADVARVLKPGGIFVGSVSFLEPYHSFNIFNWSPYGVVTVFRDNGLRDVMIRPGIDGISLTMRSFLSRMAFDTSFSMESMFNHFTDIQRENLAKSPADVNAQKLAIAGHLCFRAKKGKRFAPQRKTQSHDDQNRRFFICRLLGAPIRGWRQFGRGVLR